jgi:glutamate transport system substrate-binding protein
VPVPDDEDTGAAGRRTRERAWKDVRLVALLTLVALLAAAGIFTWWQQLPSMADLRQEAGLDGRGDLLIGVMDDMPGVSLQDPDTKQYKGFDIDVALMVAADLGFRPDQVRFYTVRNENREKMSVLEDNKTLIMDLVIAAYSITEDREKKPYVSYSSPYLRTEQSVITAPEHAPVRALDDLRGQPTCTISTATSKNPATDAGALVVYEDKISTCVDRLLSGSVRSATTDAAILGGFVAREAVEAKRTGRPTTLVHHNIGLEGEELWGINTGGNEALRKLVNISLYKSLHDPNDHRWEDAFDRNLRPEQPASPSQPIAVDRQPEAQKVEVRQWPWERNPG